MKTKFVPSVQESKVVVALVVLLGASSFGGSLTGCGSGNVFEPAVASKKNDRDKGKTALQNGDYDKAIDYLNDYIKDHPGDAQARSMLATALLKKTGIDELQLAAKITEAEKGAGKSDWTAIVSVMPAGSQKNIDNLSDAVDTLSAIPESKRTKEQNYQLALASASLAVAVVKKNTDDGSGNYAPTDEKLDTLTDEDAKLVVDNVATTAKASEASATSGDSGTSKLAGISGQIAASEGSTDRERLVSFLKAKR